MVVMVMMMVVILMIFQMELAALEKVKSTWIKNQDDSLTETDTLVSMVLSLALITSDCLCTFKNIGKAR
jgi:hypothetical protein